MKEYIVGYTYNVPEWGTVEITAKDEADASAQATSLAELSMPDTATDLVVETVKEV